MDELIKIAENGQWSLEKAHSKEIDPQLRQKIEEFMARKRAKEAKPPAPSKPSKPSEPGRWQPHAVATETSSGPSAPDASAGLRPAAIPANPGTSNMAEKERVAQLRAKIDERAAKEVKEVKEGKDKIINGHKFSDPEMRAIAERNMKIREKAQEGRKVDMRQLRAEEKGEAKNQQKGAWRDAVNILAEADKGGWKGVQRNLRNQAVMDGSVALPTKDKPLTPPQETFVQNFIDTGTRSTGTRTRQGRVHGEKATTKGAMSSATIPHMGSDGKQLVVDGKPQFKQVPLREVHNWTWDHKNRKWDHVNTTHEVADV